MEKNWVRIAACGNETLRALLVQAKGEIAEGLLQGFPQYFLRCGQTSPRPSARELATVVGAMKWHDEIKPALKGMGVPFKHVGVDGSAGGRPTTDGVPHYSGGSYKTVANGWVKYYSPTTKVVGDILEHEGATWLVLWKHTFWGGGHSTSSQEVIIVPVDSLRPE